MTELAGSQYQVEFERRGSNIASRLVYRIVPTIWELTSQFSAPVGVMPFMDVVIRDTSSRRVLRRLKADDAGVAVADEALADLRTMEATAFALKWASPR